MDSERPENAPDLGDDLIEKTRVLRAPTSQPSRDRTEVRGDLESADILIAEGLYEDAKRLLFRLIREDPKSIGARAALSRIQEAELKALLGKPQRSSKRLARDVAFEVDPEEIIEALDRDLKLGFLDSESSREVAQDSEHGAQLLATLTAFSIEDTQAVGVAYLEMGQGPTAILILRELLERTKREENTAFLGTAFLLATAYLQERKFGECLGDAQAVLLRTDLDDEFRMHFHYIAARALEGLGQREEACRAYEEVLRVDPGYRNVATRLAVLSREVGSS